VISLSATAKTNDEIITALTDIITGNIFPHMALASIAKIIASPKNRLVVVQPSTARYAPGL
jgi:hypothetical protein